MKVSSLTLQLLAIAAAATAFVPKSHDRASKQRWSPIMSLHEKSHSDDVAAKRDEYLQESSIKGSESYLDDMEKGSKCESSVDDMSESSSSKYLEDMAVENIAVEASAPGDVTETNDETKEEGVKVDCEKTLAALLRIAASTGRGEFASNAQKDRASELISILEKNNPTPEPTNSPMINGRWELVYSSSQLFRSSPFFMAGRAVCSTKDQADQYDWFCDMHRQALAISNVGTVRQVISSSLMISEFEVKVGAIPFLNDFTPFSYSGGLPFTIDGSIVSTADISPTEDGKSWELLMDTVQIKGSNIPGLRTILDNGLRLQSRGLGSFLENNLEGYTNPRPVFETTYLTEAIRISRDQDGKVFVYGKDSDDSNPTDYGKIEADLGVLKLLGGFNDAVTKL